MSDKAAQAAAQAAQTTVTQLAPPPPVDHQISSDQVLELFQKLGFTGTPERLSELLPGFRKLNSPSENLFPDNTSEGSTTTYTRNPSPPNVPLTQPSNTFAAAPSFPTRPSLPVLPTGMLEPRQNRSQIVSSFSPFSPDPNPSYNDISKQREESYGEGIPRSASMFMPGQGSHQVNPDSSSGHISTTSMRPQAIQRYHSFLDEPARAYEISHANGRKDTTISRPTSSGHAERDRGQDRNSFTSREVDTRVWRKSSESLSQFQRNQGPISRSTPSP